MKTLVCVAAYNEGVKLETTLSRFPKDRPYDVLIVDDGSTDDTAERLKRFPDMTVLRHERNLGVGAAQRDAFRYVLERGYDVIAFVAANNKDDPALIPRLLAPISEEGCDFVQGSRYLDGGSHAKMPLYRVFGTRYVHPFLFFLASGRWVSDTTNGFRAIRASLLRDPRIDLEQAWLDQYELEPYLFCKAVRLGYRVKEVPVTKIYPPKALGYTKIKPITGWWSIMRPLVLMALRLKG